MQNGAMKAWLDSSYLSGSNQSWIEQLYGDFLTDPDSVDANWRSMFQQDPSFATFELAQPLTGFRLESG